ncbi:unnamed protein product [Rotaria socialis]|uniref:GTP cyclohydrolase 1 feedback regulatory protein n=1 Tax=Rotaria socialis TaxID=392032 RepID=A0A818E3G6_9BILA|nr:unnamed protein product [Rotaria socialis]CAF3376329.1 unnamed protein product [Rotaria socialis]CAF3379576.1 unnamed protein product [Rotaria socialis]CAF3452006.1 unnamed protein product [Rotaria socialis]CAF3551208.1 unnamed protein product [Rotaria socialis]
MALAMHTTLTISCEASEERSGPTLVHSTGVKNYRIQPELIRVLQESCTNEKLCDHEKGVQCSDPPAHILETLKKVGFTVMSQSKVGSRQLWMLTKTDEGSPSNPSNPVAPPHGDNNKAKGDEEEEKEEEEEEEKEEEEE